MPLSDDQKRDLLSTAREHWLTAQSTIYAYERAVASSKTKADSLKYGTIIAAVLTTASGFTTNGWLTVIAGVVTTALATSGRVYSPATDYQKYWECSTELDGVRQNLINFSITLDVIDDLLKGAEPLKQAGDQIVNIKKRMPISPTDSDDRRARERFEVGTISQKLNRIMKATGVTITEEAPEDFELPEDAPDVVPAYRYRVR